MSQFQRETRYAVFKLKYLTEEQKQRLYDFSMELGPYNSVKECVVVESDWPNYEDTWAAIQAVHNGCYVPAAQLPDGMTLLGRRITELSAQLHDANTERSQLLGRCNSYLTALNAALEQMETDAVAKSADDEHLSSEELWHFGKMPVAAVVAKELLEQAGAA